MMMQPIAMASARNLALAKMPVRGRVWRSHCGSALGDNGDDGNVGDESWYERRSGELLDDMVLRWCLATSRRSLGGEREMVVMYLHTSTREREARGFGFVRARTRDIKSSSCRVTLA